MPIKIPDSLTKIVKDRLREMIISGELRFGQQLAENKLGAEFGVSKTPIREALVQLKEEGLVEVLARKGTFVYNPKLQDLQQLVASRAIFEVGALKLAYESNSVPLVHALGKITSQMKRTFDSTNYITYLQLDTDYHNIIIHYSGNPYLTNAHKLIASKIRALRHRLTCDSDFLERSTQGHLDIYDRLRNDRLDEACEILYQHISRVFQRVELSPLANNH